MAKKGHGKKKQSKNLKVVVLESNMIFIRGKTRDFSSTFFKS